MNLFVRRSALLILSLGIIFSFSSLIQAATYTVTRTDDLGDGICNAHCTFREAIQAAGPSDEVVFSDLFRSPQVIGLTQGHITTNGITITGPGSHLLTVRSMAFQGPISRVFNFNGSINLSGMTITGGNVNGAGAGGIAVGSGTANLNDVVVTENVSTSNAGGISMSGGTLILRNCAVTNNQSGSGAGDSGGGIRVFGASLEMYNTTVSGNRVVLGNWAGGGVYLRGGTAIVVNSTITDNEAVTGTFRAAGFYNDGFDDVYTENSIIAGNRNNAIVGDVGGQFAATSTNNLIGNVGTATGLNPANFNEIGTGAAPVDPRLYPLGNYGGNSPTHALRSNSTAIDTGSSSPYAGDQRGAPRSIGIVDKGAFEFSPMVLNTAHSGAGSLRQAIIDSPTDGIVIFDPDHFAATSRTIDINSDLPINKNLTIAGTGANFLRINSVAPFGTSSRVFTINIGMVVKISRVTISGGHDSLYAGGIANLGNLTLTSSHITGNRSQGFAGGILNLSTLLVINSTFSNNLVNGGNIQSGGAICNRGTDLTVINSTITGNSALNSTGSGGGIVSGTASNEAATVINSTIVLNRSDSTGSAGGLAHGANGTFTVRNSIVASNLDNANVPDVSGAFISAGHNLIGNVGSATGYGVIGDQVGFLAGPPPVRGKVGQELTPSAILDAGITILALNGAEVPTHGLTAFSNALDKGNCDGCSLDQRGQKKPVDLPAGNGPGLADAADIGAFEAQFVPTAAAVTVSGIVVGPDGRGIGNVRVVLTGPTGSPRYFTTNPFGYFGFDDVASGVTYFVSATHKRYNFGQQVVTVSGDLTDLVIVGQ